MCGRFVSAAPPDELAQYFSAQLVAERALEPSYNVAPTRDVYVVTSDGEARHLDAFHWGLVPPWAKDPSAGNRMINARAETLADKPVYRKAFAKRRCLIPATGFYEWKKIPGQRTKQPMFIERSDGEPLAFAGLWERWAPKKADGSYDESARLRSTTIITCAPNETMAPIHDRMPVILPATAWDRWLDPTFDDLEALGQFLVPAPPALLVVHPVSTQVNNVRNDGAELIDAV
ncbi:MAG TPA: SOS response-associated peptidase [Acidimicrobiales bacterium]|jgi:putative SOS response-associated peptidase YedK|nr:SOS response-associated peptidase [Acidimicrobiales bacterium]